MAQRVAIQLTATAKGSYLAMREASNECEDRGDAKNPSVTLYRTLLKILTHTIPEEPFSEERVLAGHFSSLYLVVQEGLCVCYVGSPKVARVVVLYIAEMARRITTDDDALGLIVGMATAGTLNTALKVLGVQTPKESSHTVNYFH
jgi:hypothetical protein